MNKLLALFTVCLTISNTSLANTTGIFSIQAQVIPSCSISTQPFVQSNRSEKNIVNVLCNNDLNTDAQMQDSSENTPDISKTLLPNDILNLTVTY
ncbi:hypothetical protein [Acinetobacter boissieri]|uniref:Spore coat protein U (SCPU) domain-containing protein n=1 Tax=Acinetobacter boissieri TaxID=1219383 RepID=A0A1G6GH28_9GAMM|nr:hypothetical protein [Acinetobacter boissieri]SDB81297.1 hypothetical protein SAMN05421733_101119 [Acinetobacter boissieri]